MTPVAQSDPALARAAWRRLEALHLVTYFSPDAYRPLAELGYRGFWMGYFAARFAPLGAVGPELAHALAYNFAACRVARALPDAWSIAGPEAALQARLRGALTALRRLLGAAADGPEVAEAAELATRCARSASPEGRGLFAAYAALPWPESPLARLWQAATLLREHRGDGHVAVLVAAGVDGRESNVLQALGGNISEAQMRRVRDYDDAEWARILEGLVGRGLVAGGELTDAGRALRERIETDTDRVAAPAYAAVSAAELRRLVDLLGPLAQAVVDGGDVPERTPMGPTFGSPGPSSA